MKSFFNLVVLTVCFLSFSAAFAGSISGIYYCDKYKNDQGNYYYSVMVKVFTDGRYQDLIRVSNDINLTSIRCLELVQNLQASEPTAEKN